MITFHNIDQIFVLENKAIKSNQQRQMIPVFTCVRIYIIIHFMMTMLNTQIRVT